jgi:hypothetical protein
VAFSSGTVVLANNMQILNNWLMKCEDESVSRASPPAGEEYHFVLTLGYLKVVSASSGICGGLLSICDRIFD